MTSRALWLFFHFEIWLHLDIVQCHVDIVGPIGDFQPELKLTGRRELKIPDIDNRFIDHFQEMFENFNPWGIKCCQS